MSLCSPNEWLIFVLSWLSEHCFFDGFFLTGGAGPAPAHATGGIFVQEGDVAFEDAGVVKAGAFRISVVPGLYSDLGGH